ncbi:hypothetical protein ES703_03845 [subsurface metagenome]
MRTAQHAQVVCDLQEKQENVQSQPDALDSRAAYNEHELEIGHLMEAIWSNIPYLSVYSVNLRFADHIDGR